MTHPPADPIEFVDRQTGEVRTETVLGNGFIRWAYLTLSGRIVSPLAFGTSIPSRLLGWYFNSKRSRRRIDRTIADLAIDTTEFARAPDEYTSFNDFFTRVLAEGARPFPADPDIFPCPADGRLLVYPEPTGPETAVAVKGVEGPLGDLFDSPIEDLEGGSAAVIRLCPADYHRYHFPCDGTVVETAAIRGRYDSVNPIALGARPRVFVRNKRATTRIETESFGRFAFVEVGAFGVAGIHDTYEGTKVRRGQEKGYFDFGGSTIVLVFPRGSLRFDADLVANSRQGRETLVQAGEAIGRSGSAE